MHYFLLTIFVFTPRQFDVEMGGYYMGGDTGEARQLSEACSALMHDRIMLQQEDELLDGQLYKQCKGDRDTLCADKEWVGFMGCC